MRSQQPGLSKDSGDSSMKVDNADITCEHRKLCPSAVTKSKRISEVRGCGWMCEHAFTLTIAFIKARYHFQAARLLLETKAQVYIDPLLTVDDICVPCARNTVQGEWASRLQTDP